MMRPRDAPSATRVISSRSRSAPRARRRPATFEHASRTRSEVPISSTHSGRCSVCRMPDRPREASVTSRYDPRNAFSCSGVVLWKAGELTIGFEHRREPGLQPGFRGFGGHAGLQPPEDVHPAHAAIEQPIPARRHLPLHHRGHPQDRGFADVHAVETRLGDADDGHGMVVEEDLPADDVAGSAERIHPELIRQHRHRMRVPRHVIRLGDEASEERACAKHREYVPDTISATTCLASPPDDRFTLAGCRQKTPSKNCVCACRSRHMG